MYVRNSIVIVLYNGVVEYVKGSADGKWDLRETGSVIAFDTSDAAHPRIIGTVHLPNGILIRASSVIGFT
jgi:hypothetical protein